jgi:hypothetical protein
METTTGFFRLCILEIPDDLLGGGRSAPGTVHPQDDRFHHRVICRFPQFPPYHFAANAVTIAISPVTMVPSILTTVNAAGVGMCWRKYAAIKSPRKE